MDRDLSDEEADRKLGTYFPAFRYAQPLLCTELDGPLNAPLLSREVHMAPPPTIAPPKLDEFIPPDRDEKEVFESLVFRFPTETAATPAKLNKKQDKDKLSRPNTTSAAARTGGGGGGGTERALSSPSTDLISSTQWEAFVILDPDAVCPVCHANMPPEKGETCKCGTVVHPDCRLFCATCATAPRPELSPVLPPPPPAAPRPVDPDDPLATPAAADADGSAPNSPTNAAAATAAAASTGPVAAAAAPSTSIFVSRFPLENPALATGEWVGDIVFDPEERVPHPPLLLDMNDKNLLLDATVDIPRYVRPQPKFPQLTGRNRIPNWQLAKMDDQEREAARLKASGLRQPFNPLEDPFNLSVDQYYQPRTSYHSFKPQLERSIVTHPPAALELAPPHFVAQLTVAQLRHFHRPRLHPETDRELKPLTPVAAVARPTRRVGGLSAREGELLMVEYSEEHPPLIQRTSMCSRLKQYYRRRGPTDTQVPKLQYGTPMTLSNKDGSPFFLGDLLPGQEINSLENNLFVAPVFLHEPPVTDFLVIKSANKFYVRTAPPQFVAGQIMPKVVVPAPESKRANQIVRDKLTAYIHRMFRRNLQPDGEALVRVEDIRTVFAGSSDANIRKRLKECSEFRRGGNETGAWVMKREQLLPLAEIERLATPETVCAYESMLAARQRLEDMGYRRQAIEAAAEAYEKDPDREAADDESKLAPWRLTADFMECVNGKCVLALSGPGEPTGCGEGFSMLRMTTKAGHNPDSRLLPKVDLAARQSQGPLAKTENDLRKLKLAEARNILVQKFGMPWATVKGMHRWEVVGMVRKMANENDGEESRFVRTNKSAGAEHRDKFRAECQRLFDLQARTLRSDEVLSSDESSSDEEMEEARPAPAAAAAESTTPAATPGVTPSPLVRASSSLTALATPAAAAAAAAAEDDDDRSVLTGTARKDAAALRKIVIHRYYRDSGRLVERREVISDPRLVAGYLRQVQTDAKSRHRRVYDATEVLQKEKTKLEETTPSKQLNITCTRCRMKGHMRTNKSCPLYVEEDDTTAEAPTTTVDGTRMTFKIPKSKGRKRPADQDFYFDDMYQTDLKSLRKDRTKRNPDISLNRVFSEALALIKRNPCSAFFLKPVDTKMCPDYPTIVKSPMDISTMQQKAEQGRYQSRRQFMEDVRLMCYNALVYNGESDPHSVYDSACRVRELIWDQLKEQDGLLTELELALNALDTLVANDHRTAAEERRADLAKYAQRIQAGPAP